MHPLEHEIQAVKDAFSEGQLTLEERNYLLQEIKDVKAAQECADDEETFRYIVQACNLAMSLT